MPAKQTAKAPAAAAELTGLCSTRTGTHAVGCFPACTKEPRHAPAGSRDASHSSWLLVPFHHTAEGHNRISSCLISSRMLSDVVKVVWYSCHEKGFPNFLTAQTPQMSAFKKSIRYCHHTEHTQRTQKRRTSQRDYVL